MILTKKDSNNPFHHADGSIGSKSVKTDTTEKDGSDLLFLIAACVVLSLVIFYTG
jgi:hypothetical protein